MATYCYRCKACNASFNVPTYGLEQTPCPTCGQCCLVRNYQAEAVGIGAGVRVSRDGTAHEQRDLFLPSNRDLAGPGDPDGTKGMRQWREEHQPKEAVANPLWPGEVEKKVW